MDFLSRVVEGMIVTLREGVEVALVIGILLAALRRCGREAYARYIYLGLGVAVAASLLGGAIFQRYGLDPDNPLLEGSVMFVAATLVASLVAWMWRMGKSVRQRLEHRLHTLVGGPDAAAVPRRAAAGVFAFTFFMTFREGVETVLFLLALSQTTAGGPAYNLLGGALGLVLACLFGVLLVRRSVHLNLRRFFAVTGVALLILVLKLVAGGLREFFEIGLLPSSPVLEAAVGLLTHKITSYAILALLIVLPGACLAWECRRNGRPPEAPLPSQPNGAGA
jgi:high-affinity iron transporter